MVSLRVLYISSTDIGVFLPYTQHPGFHCRSFVSKAQRNDVDTEHCPGKEGTRRDRNNLGMEFTGSDIWVYTSE